MNAKSPRLVVAGLSGDSGKTIVSLSLLAAWRSRGKTLAAFKKGPDYIDAAWLSWASDRPCRNLDTYLMSPPVVRENFVSHAARVDLALIEGNRGLFDGKDIEGTHSTAELAKLLAAPVVLVVNVRKATRTVAALVAGCCSFDPDVNIVGVILNRVAGKRHGSVIAGAIEKYCGLPILGMVPVLGEDAGFIPERHLGLVPPTETDSDSRLLGRFSTIAATHLDLDMLARAADQAPALEETAAPKKRLPRVTVDIGFFSDAAFTFYYPENLEALEQAGARLVPIDSLSQPDLPPIDALYIGGGFPETHASQLADNHNLMTSVRRSADSGMPVYAECGGLVYLSRSLRLKDATYPMTGVFPLDLEMHEKPAGHGYTELEVDRENPYFEPGSALRGHEFHYTVPVAGSVLPPSCLCVRTGVGVGDGRDGLICGNAMAAYSHIHASGVPQWAGALVARVLEYKRERSTETAANERKEYSSGGQPIDEMLMHRRLDLMRS